MLKIYGEKQKEINLTLLDGSECHMSNDNIGLCVVDEDGKLIPGGILIKFNKKSLRVSIMSAIDSTLGFKLTSDNRLIIHEY